jgi:hypothetical protein
MKNVNAVCRAKRRGKVEEHLVVAFKECSVENPKSGFPTEPLVTT